MTIIRMIISIFALLLWINTAQATVKEISITIDDLPFVGTGGSKEGVRRFNQILQALVDAHVPATGFVIAGSIAKGQWELLENFQRQGFIIGNHTFTHANLNHVSAQNYIEEIAKADERLTPLMTNKKYFRYPYLAEGRGQNKERVKEYLAENQYIIAPVTIDSKDFLFNMQLLAINWRHRGERLEKIKQRYLSYIWKQTELAEKSAHGKPVKQILLIHANLLNSHLIGDVIQLYKEHGYRFISLQEALTSERSSNELKPEDIIESSLTELLNKFASIKSLTDNLMV